MQGDVTRAWSDWGPQYNSRNSQVSSGTLSYGDDYMRLYKAASGYYASGSMVNYFAGWGTMFDINPGDTIHIEYTSSASTGQYAGTPVIGQASNGSPYSVQKTLATTSTKTDLIVVAVNKNQQIWIDYENANGTLDLRIFNIWVDHTA